MLLDDARGRWAAAVDRAADVKPTERRTAVRTIVLLLCALLIAMFTLFPLYWAVVTTLRVPAQVLTSHSLVPSPASFENVRDLFRDSPFGIYFLNTAIVSLSVMVITIVVTTPMAYLLTRTKSRILRGAAVALLIAYMVPEVLTLIPIFVGLVTFQLDDTRLGLIIALLPVTVPFGVWILTGFFRTLPYEAEEASRVDGATWFQTFWFVVLPVARSGLITVAIFSFIFAWIDYLVASVVITEQSLKTLSVGLAGLFGRFNLSYGQIMAAVLIMTIPMLFAVALVGRKIVGGLTIGGTKE